MATQGCFFGFEEEELHKAPVLQAMSERLSSSMPEPEPKRRHTVKAHGDVHEMLPLGQVVAVAFYGFDRELRATFPPRFFGVLERLHIAHNPPRMANPVQIKFPSF